MSARISSFMAKDCDGVDPDNVDSVSRAEALPIPQPLCPYQKKVNHADNMLFLTVCQLRPAPR